MKKTLSLLVALVLTLSLVAVPAFADTTANVVGYSADRIEAKDLTNIPCLHMLAEEAYATATEFKISSVDDLFLLADNVNKYWQTFTGVTIYLEKDLDLDEAKWTPVGYNESGESNYFAGTFDGQGHVIDNFKVEDELAATHAIGVFGLVKGATIKNLVVGSRAVISYTGTHGDVRVGGLAGDLRNVCTLDNNYVLATVSSATNYCGGIVGCLNAAGSIIKNTTFAGTADGGQRVGGILGYLGNCNGTIENCRNTGEITNNATAAANAYTGGIVGMLNNKVGVCAVKNCINNGEINGLQSANGGITGMTRGDTTYEGNINYGVVELPKELFTTSGIFAAYYEEADAAKQKILEGNQNKMGETDATLSTVPTVTPDFFTGECDLSAMTPPTTDAPATDAPATNKPTTNKPTTSAPTTEAPATQAPTEEPKKGGCGAAIGGSLAIVMMLGAAVAVTKKRK